MVLQAPQANVCSGSQSLEASPGLVAQRLAVTAERARTVTADENSSVANSRLRIVKDQLWPVIRG